MARQILIGGGSGFVGRRLIQMLEREGYDVTIISRTEKLNKKCITWDAIKQNGLPKCYAVVNLAGNLLIDPTKRWNDAFKNSLVQCRVGTTKLLADAISTMSEPPSAFVAASAIGCYTPSETAEYTEESEIRGDDFMVSLVKQWEQSGQLTHTKTRHSIVRIGVVLGREGGLIKNVYLPFYLGVGGPVGSGQQIMAWVHVDDVAGIITHAIKNESVTGVLNAVSPQTSTYSEFTSALARAMWRFAFFRTPEWVLQLVFGKEVALVMTGSQNVQPKRTLESGYKFLYPDLTSACAEIVSSKNIPK